MDLLASAVLNNVDWCALVCGGGGMADTTTGVWLAAGNPPPLYPDAVTLKRGVSVRDVIEAVSGREACSVKDSYADVDLTPYGFSELFTAQWIGRINAPSTVELTGWSPLTEPSELASWCAAAELPDTLPVGLLQSPSVRILAVHRQGRLAAGAIANSNNTVVGISNVFQISDDGPWVWHEVASAVTRFFAGQPIVGYEHGPDLNAAIAAGFTDLGPLRIWLRLPTP